MFVVYSLVHFSSQLKLYASTFFFSLYVSLSLSEFNLFLSSHPKINGKCALFIVFGIEGILRVLSIHLTVFFLFSLSFSVLLSLTVSFSPFLTASRSLSISHYFWVSFSVFVFLSLSLCFLFSPFFFPLSTISSSLSFVFYLYYCSSSTWHLTVFVACLSYLPFLLKHLSNSRITKFHLLEQSDRTNVRYFHKWFFRFFWIFFFSVRVVFRKLWCLLVGTFERRFATKYANTTQHRLLVITS